MATVFESISDGFYTAFFEPDPEIRRNKIETWIVESAPIIQSAVENDLGAYLEEILVDTWTEKGWKSRVEKFLGQTQGLGRRNPLPFIDTYRLHLDVKLRPHEPSDKDIVGVLTPVTLPPKTVTP